MSINRASGTTLPLPNQRQVFVQLSYQGTAEPHSTNSAGDLCSSCAAKRARNPFAKTRCAGRRTKDLEGVKARSSCRMLIAFIGGALIGAILIWFYLAFS